MKEMIKGLMKEVVKDIIKETMTEERNETTGHSFSEQNNMQRFMNTKMPKELTIDGVDIMRERRTIPEWLENPGLVMGVLEIMYERSKFYEGHDLETMLQFSPFGEQYMELMYGPDNHDPELDKEASEPEPDDF